MLGVGDVLESHKAGLGSKMVLLGQDLREQGWRPRPVEGCMCREELKCQGWLFGPTRPQPLSFKVTASAAFQSCWNSYVRVLHKNAIKAPS